MVTVGLYVHLEAKPGREDDVAQFLSSALPLVESEPATSAWFALRLGETSFAIFDVFPDESGRQAHLEGPVAATLHEQAGSLLTAPPEIRALDVIASTL